MTPSVISRSVYIDTLVLAVLRPFGAESIYLRPSVALSRDAQSDNMEPEDTLGTAESTYTVSERDKYIGSWNSFQMESRHHLSFIHLLSRGQGSERRDRYSKLSASGSHA